MEYDLEVVGLVKPTGGSASGRPMDPSPTLILEKASSVVWGSGRSGKPPKTFSNVCKQSDYRNRKR